MQNNFEPPRPDDYSDYERMRRRELRRSRRGCGGSGVFGGGPTNWPVRQGMGFAVIMILFGVFLFLDNIGVIAIRELWQFWPVVIALVGFQHMISSDLWSGRVWGGLLVVLAALWIAHNIGALPWGMGAVWSLFLAGVGFMLLVKNFEEPSPAPAQNVSGLETAVEQPEVEPPDPDTYHKDWVIFSGTKRRIRSQNFKGGELIAIFGGIDLDLRRAGVTDPTRDVVIDTIAVFGGIVIKVPENWRVVLRGVAVFGAYEDKTIPPVPAAGVQIPTVVITGSAVFGGVSIEQ